MNGEVMKGRGFLSSITHGVKSLLKHQQGSREANDKDRLGSDDAKDDPLDAGGDHQLRHSHHLLRFVS